MTAVLRSPVSDETAEQRFVLQGVSWAAYGRLLRELGDRLVRLTYDRGSLELTSPSPEHEQYKRLIGRLIEILSYELDVPVASFGSSTLRREDLARGLEADECYYVQNESRVRRKRSLNLKKDPPPDLVVEIDLTHHAANREAIYADLGVPEIWRFDGSALTMLHLRRGRYVPHATSLAFPDLPAAQVERFTRMLWTTSQSAIMRKFAEWAKKNLT